ncbi:GntR family transcriptional regulator [Amycolatopsis sp. OK19-0408]|uniref:GntR family transcriptional regulator n=1 Tax=Amycolatopsis iheyensis TaxID=2945988 RepID=A0A9X2N9G0_9PSEU|nr:GntR family transcriptional regulator [Amycolatopsis iheyensis]MCR6483036.1 GntR family transcriptional regulator [Amycolatopsis iheyensis]
MRAVPSEPGLTTVQHATLRWLRDRIATGAFESGMQLRQEVLAREFGVSVPPIREALQTLEAEGQVVYKPRRGYFVATLSADELVETYRIRDLLETEAITRAVPILGDDDLERMRTAIADMAAAHDREDLAALTEANRRFHFTVFDAATMPRMAQMIRVLWESTDRYRFVYFSSSRNRKRVDVEHKAIMDAVAAGRVDDAVRLHREHRDHALEAVCASIPTAEPRQKA